MQTGSAGCACSVLDSDGREARVMPAWIAHADWGTAPAKRVVATAELGDGVYLAHAPETVASTGGLLERMHVVAGQREPTLLGFDFPIGVPRAYAQLAGIGNFAAWFRALDLESQFFDVAVDVADVSLSRPFFPKRIAAKTPGIKNAFHAALGLSGSQARRRCDLAHCRRGAASDMFWTLGPQAVGKATLTGWKDLLRPALAEPARRYAIWPFDGDLSKLLVEVDAVIVETYPADAYLQLGLRMGSPGTAKTNQAHRRADAPRLLDWCNQNAVLPDDNLLHQLEDGFGSTKAGEDLFDATIGLFAMINTIRHQSEPELPDDPAIIQHEGWMFGQHATCGQDRSRGAGLS